MKYVNKRIKTIFPLKVRQTETETARGRKRKKKMRKRELGDILSIELICEKKKFVLYIQKFVRVEIRSDY